MAAAAGGEIWLAGCGVGDDDPQFHCADCGAGIYDDGRWELLAKTPDVSNPAVTEASSTRWSGIQSTTPTLPTGVGGSVPSPLLLRIAQLLGG